ncbi:MAG: DUF6795 domain-containing protein [Pseudomonadota bacterium]
MMRHPRTINRGLFPLTVLLLATSTFLYSSEVMADMFGWFKRYDVHLSPAVKGRILKDGEPVPDVKIFRELTYEKEYLDQTQTNDEGYFELPAKWIRSGIPGRMFDQTRIRQIVDAEKDGQSYLLWYTNTPSIEPEKTVTEKLGALHCDLSTPEKLHHFTVAEDPNFTHDVFSICRWTDQ